VRRNACKFFAAFAALVLSCGPVCETPARAASGPVAPTDGFSVKWIADPVDARNVCVEVHGLDQISLQALRRVSWELAQWQQLFPVFAEQGGITVDLTVPPMLGTYVVASNSVRFAPQFPLEPRVKYRARFRPEQLPGPSTVNAKAVTATFQLPTPSSIPVTIVAEVYPTADVLPENLLKFYLHFSNPMRRGHVYSYIHLLDERGKEVELPFLEIGEELWDDSLTRLTLFIDPGRIKRGVTPREEIGPSLQTGKQFTFVIDPAWEDATGNSLKQGFRRTFRVGPPDREPMDMSQWKVQAPSGGSRAPLQLSFPKPVDHALALRVLHVRTAAGDFIEGDSELQDSERCWVFTPKKPWSRGPHKVTVQNAFEDLAGNNIGKPFEVDLFEGVQRRLTNSVWNLPFQVR